MTARRAGVPERRGGGLRLPRARAGVLRRLSVSELCSFGVSHWYAIVSSPLRPWRRKSIACKTHVLHCLRTGPAPCSLCGRPADGRRPCLPSALDTLSAAARGAAFGCFCRYVCAPCQGALRLGRIVYCVPAGHSSQAMWASMG